jgi:hypothetical protein
LDRDVAATPKRPPASPLRAGIGSRVHAEPVHCKITPLVEPSPLPLSPTAHDLSECGDATPKRLMPPPNVGDGTFPHVWPFHRSIKLVPGPQPQLLPLPTAQVGLPGESVTLLRKLARPCPLPGFGLGIGRQVCPFQCRIRVSPLFVVPTAQALLGEVAATPARVPAVLGIGRHVVPFQCRMRVSPVLVEPTAQALLGEVAATPERDPAGLGT